MCTLFCAFNTCVSCITLVLGLAASHSSKDPPSLAYWLFASPQLISVRWCCRGRTKREKKEFFSIFLALNMFGSTYSLRRMLSIFYFLLTDVRLLDRFLPAVEQMQTPVSTSRKWDLQPELGMVKRALSLCFMSDHSTMQRLAGENCFPIPARVSLQREQMLCTNDIRTSSRLMVRSHLQKLSVCTCWLEQSSFHVLSACWLSF